jgi:murein DD-endopeptidase MepM/ murein hydrolase activator NlpD
VKNSDEAYTIMIFRGATTNPMRLRLRKITVRRALITATVLVFLQMGIMSHYVVQTSQVSELSRLQTEIGETRGQTKTFFSSIEDMKQRMLVMQELNRKLQTMFGLEPDSVKGIEINGQGGEEFPYASAVYSEPRQSLHVSKMKNQANSIRDSSQTSLLVKIEQGLVWLERKASREQKILDSLAATAGERVDRWASIPSIWPVKGHITSKFGPRISPFTGKKAFHSGLDIGSPRGREIRAPASGKVVAAAYHTRMGNFIRINHGYGVETTYGHLSKMLVRYGKRVKRGDVIGLVGSTGRFSTGPHLHYQVAVNDKAVNPMQYILD